jgi:hypothetical protein
VCSAFAVTRFDGGAGRESDLRVMSVDMSIRAEVVTDGELVMTDEYKWYVIRYSTCTET